VKLMKGNDSRQRRDVRQVLEPSTALYDDNVDNKVVDKALVNRLQDKVWSAP